jgi:hypothetical protein
MLRFFKVAVLNRGFTPALPVLLLLAAGLLAKTGHSAWNLAILGTVIVLVAGFELASTKSGRAWRPART